MLSEVQLKYSSDKSVFSVV